MKIKTKLRNFYGLTLLFSFILVFNPTSYAQKYSIDKEVKIKKKRRPLKHIFKKDAAKVVARQIRKDDKQQTKVLKNEQKNNKIFQEKANDVNESGKTYKVSKRIKRYEKKSKRTRNNKREKNFFQRLFTKK